MTLCRECNRVDVLSVAGDDEVAWTALHYLVYDNDVDAARALVSSGDLSTEAASLANTAGDTPLMMALKARGPHAPRLASFLIPVSDIVRGYAAHPSFCARVGCS